MLHTGVRAASRRRGMPLVRAWPRRVCCASPTRAPPTCLVPSARNTHTSQASLKSAAVRCLGNPPL
eukprot:2148936-Prymnesium_polylepis.1